MLHNFVLACTMDTESQSCATFEQSWLHLLQSKQFVTGHGGFGGRVGFRYVNVGVHFFGFGDSFACVNKLHAPIIKMTFAILFISEFLTDDFCKKRWIVN